MVEQSRRKGAYQPKALSEILSRVVNPILEQRAGMNGDLVAAWAELAGERYAECSLPVKLIWPPARGPEDRFEPATLLVACDPAQAVYLQHEASQIISRINFYFGFDAVVRMRIEQRRPEQHVKTSASRRPPPIRASRNDQQRVAAMIAVVENPKLKAALQRMGEAVFSKGSSRSGDG
ncbi:MAG: DciA family protein [Pseudomonadota bacterium]